MQGLRSLGNEVINVSVDVYERQLGAESPPPPVPPRQLSPAEWDPANLPEAPRIQQSGVTPPADAGENERAKWKKEDYYEWVRESFSKSDFAEAAKRLDEAKLNFPEWSKLEFARGVLYHAQDKLDQARAAYLAAIELNEDERAVDPESLPLSGAYNNLAVIALLLADQEDALGRLKLQNEAVQHALTAIDLESTVSPEAQDRPAIHEFYDTLGSILPALAEGYTPESDSWLYFREQAAKAYQQAAAACPEEEAGTKTRYLEKAASFSWTSADTLPTE